MTHEHLIDVLEKTLPAIRDAVKIASYLHHKGVNYDITTEVKDNVIALNQQLPRKLKLPVLTTSKECQQQAEALLEINNAKEFLEIIIHKYLEQYGSNASVEAFFLMLCQIWETSEMKQEVQRTVQKASATLDQSTVSNVISFRDYTGHATMPSEDCASI